MPPVAPQHCQRARRPRREGGVSINGKLERAKGFEPSTPTSAKLEKYIRFADERLEKYLAQLDDADRSDEAGTTRRGEALAAKIAKVREQRSAGEAMLEQSKASGESQIPITNPDARAMAAHPKLGVGYNAQVALDAKHKLIVEQLVTNAGTDVRPLAETVGAAKDLLGVSGSIRSLRRAITWVRTSSPANESAQFVVIRARSHFDRQHPNSGLSERSSTD